MIAFALIFSYACHELGDYVFQSDWMANEKTKKHLPALAHAVVYTLMFVPLVFFGASWTALAVIGSTHFLIDRYRLARYVCWAKNILAPRFSRLDKTFTITIPLSQMFQRGDILDLTVQGEAGTKPYEVTRLVDAYTANVEEIQVWRHPWKECAGTGYHHSRPPWMAVWLMIRADNALHMTINLLSLYLLRNLP